ncbi:uncharacterized protein [Spinacia oleracea]|uniref:DUF4218 domain-containing protein n=1 Tax=Spinacia oleracea TaxID=3562 RepID=A0ABM3QZK6_SPIOL|nr:uncharacterized protein LOC130463588 [Spinacia oleracea]
MKRTERKWMYDRLDGRNIKPEFLNGVTEFIERFYDVETVILHLYKKGFVHNYYEWVCQGESFGESVSRVQTNPYREMVIDALGNNQEHMLNEEVDVVEEEPNGEAKKLIDLLKAAEDPLYEGSNLSVLEMASRIASLKCEFNLQHRCVDGFASLMNDAIPNNNQMGRTFNSTKKVLHGLELPHERIHTCPKGCLLFWKADAQLDKCRVCGSDRYRKTSRGKLVPAKVMIYFPITPRLQRLYATKNVSKDMTWHAKNPRVQNTFAHPSDSEAWKHLDATFPDFALEPRNVRLGLCTDGFSPHGKFGSQYSCWPVILIPYNFPPSMCMKKPFMFLSLLVPDPKNPKGHLDVYMQPLIEELKQLWEVGAMTYDISSKQNFNLRAAVLWTISDFPAYGMLSGWSTAGKKACPYCMDKSKAFWLEHGGKVSWFDSHRQFLPQGHPFRKNKTAFCKNKVENGMGPHIMSGEELWQCVKDLPKATDGPEALKKLKSSKKGWFKQSIMWELPYWKDLLLRHNLDVMHIEKNFFDQLINTVMDVKGSTSDTANARKDMEKYYKRRQLELENGSKTMPKAPFALDKAQKKVLCEWVRDLKFPDGFASNLSRCVNLQSYKLHGMKSHDCHVFMERLLPVALVELLPLHVWKAITEISQFFRDLCAPTIKMSDIDRLDKNIVEILCKLEKIFPPAFFNSMEHLPVHLPHEAKVGGPVQYRWMYPFERFLNHLKRKVGNKARVEASICNAYLMEEISNFCSNYFQPEVETKARDLGRNVNSVVENQDDVNIPEMFRVDSGRAPINGRLRYLQDKEYDRAHLYVLANSGILGDYERKFEEHIRQIHPHIAMEDIWSKFEAQYPEWFKSHVLRSLITDDVIRALAMGPSRQVRTWSHFYVNGYNFHTHDYGKHKSTMNYGVCVQSPEEIDYFGILEEVVEVAYCGKLREYKTILFKCSWMDSVKGMNIHEQYKLVEVNHSKRYPKYDPFVLSYQVSQVYFAHYPSLKRDKDQWWVVFKTKARSVIDAPVDLEFLQEDVNEVSSAICAPDEIPDYEDQEDDEDVIDEDDVEADEFKTSGDEDAEFETSDDDDVDDEFDDDEFDDDAYDD